MIRRAFALVVFAGVALGVFGPSAIAEPEALAYGQDEVCADRCRAATQYCMNECQKPHKECFEKCKVDPEHKSPRQFSAKETACLKACNDKAVPCRNACGKSRGACFKKCQH